MVKTTDGHGDQQVAWSGGGVARVCTTKQLAQERFRAVPPSLNRVHRRGFARLAAAATRAQR